MDTKIIDRLHYGIEILDRFANGEIAIDIGSNEEGNDLMAWVCKSIPNSEPDPDWYSDNEYEDYSLVCVEPKSRDWAGPFCNGYNDEDYLPDKVKEVIPYSKIAPYLNMTIHHETECQVAKLNLEEVL